MPLSVAKIVVLWHIWRIRLQYLTVFVRLWWWCASVDMACVGCGVCLTDVTSLKDRFCLTSVY